MIRIGRIVAALLIICLIFTARPQAEDMKAAAQNYEASCAGCHATSGHGDGKGAMTLKTKPGDFTDCSRMAKFSDEELFKIVKSGGLAGGESADMPAYSAGYSDDEIHALVAYVRHFCDKQTRKSGMLDAAQTNSQLSTYSAPII